jgi:hypothetical protein
MRKEERGRIAEGDRPAWIRPESGRGYAYVRAPKVSFGLVELWLRA